MRFVWMLLVLGLGGCNWIGNVTGLNTDANKAIGAGCRQTGRSLEECYIMEPDADKAAVYAGWREMNEYMAKNKLQTMAPPPPKASSAPAVAPPPPPPKKEASDAMGAGANFDGSKFLTNEEADKAAKNDPQVQAVLAAIRQKPPQDKKAAEADGEAGQKRLVGIINELNKNGK